MKYARPGAGPKRGVGAGSRRGGFATTFARFSIPRCIPYAVHAKGNRGSRAYLKVVPDCAQPAATTDELFPTDPVPKGGRH